LKVSQTRHIDSLLKNDSCRGYFDPHFTHRHSLEGVNRS
jgi:hypothetical protein